MALINSVQSHRLVSVGLDGELAWVEWGVNAPRTSVERVAEAIALFPVRSLLLPISSLWSRILMSELLTES
ncbi:hypothetical protein [Oscillatoria sp. HE19RPO]|uniref:hypothetical protein n=1 Tax=Oscillatoria sp. HE19RPO TaxID=2954806 RepID=UPI0020C51E1D|nr:hypothetical protein [Oscillatoria sp. HE19RPO]